MYGTNGMKAKNQQENFWIQIVQISPAVLMIQQERLYACKYLLGLNHYKQVKFISPGLDEVALC